MIQKFFDSILGPFRQLRSTIFRVQQIPANIKGEIKRGTHEAKSFGLEAKNAVSKGKEMKGKVEGGAKSAKEAGAKAAAAKPGKVKMGFFSKSKKCQGCGQKLHPSWEECPYCGFGKAGAGGPSTAAPGAPPAVAAAARLSSAPSPSPGGAQRTMALDLGAGPPTGTGIIGWFIPLEGSKTGELFELRGRVTVGSKEDNQICVPETSISGRHCEFVGSAGGFKINDLGSTNGTYVNDKRVQSHDLVDNDNVTLGKIRFKFKSLV